MNLLDVRKKFIELSGRIDLVKDLGKYKDNGANFYIQAGQDFLDRRRTTAKSQGRYFESLSAGEWYASFPRCRSIKNVWVNDDQGRSEMEKRNLIWLRNEYPDPIADTDQGTPLYYSPSVLRTIDSSEMNSVGSFFNYVMTDDDLYRGVIILPPPDESVVIEVWGNFLSTELTSDTSESYWTINHPMDLVFAALYMLEVSYRNMEGANGWLLAMTEITDDIDKDVADEESADDIDEY